MTASTATSELRGIAAAMSQPVFSTRTAASALGTAERAARRWAPESPEDQPRSVKSMSFVDRTVAPWITTAQRSAGLRMFSQYAAGGTGERVVDGVSWVFPRPWYQDELDWIAASRASAAGQGTIFTTRGTYARAGEQTSAAARLAPELGHYVAPSFAPEGPSTPAYSPLVAESTFSAATIVAQSMRAIAGASAMARGLSAPTAMVEAPAPSAVAAAARSLAGFSSIAPLVSELIPRGELPSLAIARRAPELVTPPSPRGEEDLQRPAPVDEHAAQAARAQAVEQSRAMAQLFAQQRERIVAQEREAAKQQAVSAQAAAPAPVVSEAAAAQEAARVEIMREALRVELARSEATREARTRVQGSARQQARVDALIAERLAQLEGSASPPVATATAVAPPVETSWSEPQKQQTLVSALRFAELMAHTASIGGASLAPSAGPRVAMPSGLGGLITAVSTAQAIEAERAQPAAFGPAMARRFVEQAAPLVGPAPGAPERFAPAFGFEMPRALVAPTFAPAFATAMPAAEAARESALGAVAAHRPAALAHVAWSDRWLGRFAGASESSLEAMSTVAMRSRLAPEQHFVAPVAPAAAVVDAGEVAAAPGRAAPVRSSLPIVVTTPEARVDARPEVRAVVAPAVAPVAPVEAPRFADDDVVPDEMLAAIMAPRPAQSPSRQAPRPATTAAVQGPEPALRYVAPRLAAADVIALTAPAAPADAGLAPALAASPMAPALQHVLPLAKSAVFDPRALAGVELASAFLAGTVTAPIVAQRTIGGTVASFDDTGFEPAASSPWQQWAAQWTAELVRPVAAERELGTTPSQVQPGAVATPARTAAGGAAPMAASDDGIVTMRSTLLAPATPRQVRLAATHGTSASWVTHEPSDTMPAAYQTLGELLEQVVSSSRSPAVAAALAASVSGGSPLAGPLPGGVASAVFGEAPTSAGRGFELPVVFLPTLAGERAAMSAGVGSALGVAGAAGAWTPLSQRAVLGGGVSPDVLTSAAVPSPAQPVVGARAWPSAAWSEFGDAPMLAAPLFDVGLAGSMEQGAHAPGMTAQRALGFGAVQSTQAADLSFDFVPPELVLAARVYGLGPAEAAQAVRLAMGGTSGLAAMAGAVDLRFVAMAAPTARAAAGDGDAQGAGPSVRASDRAAAALGQPVSESAGAEQAFGVARRTPRGAFLLPAASVGAMGLSAAAPDGDHAMPLAALELLAAKLVAELGTYASPAVADAPATARRAGAPSLTPIAPPLAALAGEASEQEVLASAATSVGAARRARFDALYLALADSPAGRTMSPAARAARALAMANRDEESASLSSRERAALAWQIYPVVLGGDGGAAGASEGTPAGEAGRGARVRERLELPTVAPEASARLGAELRPGLGALSARAGEALSSFVTASPTDAPKAQPAAESQRSWRSGRFGGGEVEIPAWFESAARKMFEEQRDVEGMSLAELTLITAPPPQQIAAASRDTPASAPPKQASSGDKGEKGQKIDIEKVAREVYSAFLSIIESARQRNGEPYL